MDRATGNSEIKSLANSIGRDIDAVRAATTNSWITQCARKTDQQDQSGQVPNVWPRKATHHCADASSCLLENDRAIIQPRSHMLHQICGGTADRRMLTTEAPIGAHTS
ncbi:hypothetical protein [Bradyrhizobium sp. B117]|uniref:hypothetical protein n=1 Tax=Bradyrhizobium sp. B117 TaxID=3140246 RepID=UPI0031832547